MQKDRSATLSPGAIGEAHGEDIGETEKTATLQN
jgi:hypothetical protein